LNPEEEDLDRHQSDAVQLEPSASGASDVAHPDATAAEVPPRLRLVDADAGKLAGRAPDALALDASQLEDSSVVRVPEDAAVEPYIPDEAQSAARSCAAQAAVADLQQQAERLDAEQPEFAEAPMLRSAEPSGQEAPLQEPLAQRVERQDAASLPRAVLVEQAAQRASLLQGLMQQVSREAPERQAQSWEQPEWQTRLAAKLVSEARVAPELPVSQQLEAAFAADERGRAAQPLLPSSA
jgi:hypothetical protein